MGSHNTNNNNNNNNNNEEFVKNQAPVPNIGIVKSESAPSANSNKHEYEKSPTNS